VVPAAACALLVSCASETVAPPGALDYRPAPRSALVSSRDQIFLVAQRQQGPQLTTVLALQRAGAKPQPVARVVRVRQGQDLQVSIQRLPLSGSPAEVAVDQVATLEQLYGMVFRQEPKARYCLGEAGRPCNAMRDGVAHAKVLNALAAAREQEALRVPAAVPWQVVEMNDAPARSADADVVSVRITVDRAPLAGIEVHFDRPPHSICSGRTGGDGMAACRLVDSYGDEHEDEHSVPVVATFPGVVRTDGVLLPTTYVLR
jgi:hypothetical protein